MRKTYRGEGEGVDLVGLQDNDFTNVNDFITVGATIGHYPKALREIQNNTADIS